ncbi:MAG: tRNA (N6-threonylcarbamoyladenosine(37)-N6)-methyltransferase TrmO [Clostridia bacterium]|nr:tRNA (N6-threonylcarbamoyladenosine(37)-N6)-methyltransferase TrmO [Clostridia bacterium]
MKTVARIRTDFPTKFGIPRQSGMCDELKAEIIFEPEFRAREAVRGIEDFSHLWLIWGFSEVKGDNYSPTVRPPKLGGNKRMGVFATRSPFRPNRMGLSCVKLLSVRYTEQDGTILTVSGADMVDGTPIYDIKPYVPYTDCHTEATGGFSKEPDFGRLKVILPTELAEKLPREKINALTEVLSLDPRPGYIDEPDRVYGFGFAGFEVKFKVESDVLTVTDLQKI